MQNTVLAWLQETIQRLFIKMPKFFKVWAWISGALVVITGLPDFITMLPLGVTVPDLWNEKITTIVAWASRGILLMSLLTTQSKPVGVTTAGDVIKVTDDKKLPFTAATEQKSAEKVVEVTTVSSIPDIPGGTTGIVDVRDSKSIYNKPK